VDNAFGSGLIDDGNSIFQTVRRLFVILGGKRSFKAFDSMFHAGFPGTIANSVLLVLFCSFDR